MTGSYTYAYVLWFSTCVWPANEQKCENRQNGQWKTVSGRFLNRLRRPSVSIYVYTSWRDKALRQTNRRDFIWNGCCVPFFFFSTRKHDKHNQTPGPGTCGICTELIRLTCLPLVGFNDDTSIKSGTTTNPLLLYLRAFNVYMINRITRVYIIHDRTRRTPCNKWINIYICTMWGMKLKRHKNSKHSSNALF